ncbi:MAG: NAD(P)H-quinone oxidoreductase [Longimicrobiales bacterium]
MRALRITRPGGPDVLEIRDDIPAPEPGPGQIRVRVVATAINRADLSQIAGRYPAPPGFPQDIPGLEYAGTVDALGPSASVWRIGDHVMGITGGGAWAEYVVIHEGEAIAVPPGLTLERAAAVPEVFITAHDAIASQMALRAGEILLIHGVGSGVGTAAIQIGNAIGATVWGTARSAWKLERARALGLALGMDTSVHAFPDITHVESGGRGVDAVLDLVGGDSLRANVRALAQHGRIIIVGVVAGAIAELDMRSLMGKRALIRGTVLRARPLDEKIAVARTFAEFSNPLFENGSLQPVIDRILPFEQVRGALEAMARNETFGKVVLVL